MRRNKKFKKLKEGKFSAAKMEQFRRTSCKPILKTKSEAAADRALKGILKVTKEIRIERRKNRRKQKSIGKKQKQLVNNKQKNKPYAGYKSYQDYINGELWQIIRARILVRDNYICAICLQAANTVHHRSYSKEVMAGLHDEQLVTLCWNCHTFIEYYQNGRKRYLSDVNDLFR